MVAFSGRRSKIKMEMETKSKKNLVKSVEKNEITNKKPKSKTTIFWEKYPNGILKIVDMRAVLR